MSGGGRSRNANKVNLSALVAQFESLDRDAASSRRPNRSQAISSPNREGSAKGRLAKSSSELHTSARSPSGAPRLSSSPILSKKVSADGIDRSPATQRSVGDSPISEASSLTGKRNSRDRGSYSSVTDQPSSPHRKPKVVTSTIKERMQRFNKSSSIDTTPEATSPRVDRADQSLGRRRSNQLLGLMGKFESHSHEGRSPSPNREPSLQSMRSSKSFNDLSRNDVREKDELDPGTPGVIASSGNSTSLSLTDVSSAGRHVPSESPLAADVKLGRSGRRRSSTDDVTNPRTRRRSSSRDGETKVSSSSTATGATAASEAKDSPPAAEEISVKSPVNGIDGSGLTQSAATDTGDGERRSSRVRRSSSRKTSSGGIEEEQKTSTTTSARKMSSKTSASDSSLPSTPSAGRTSPSSRRRLSTESVRSSKSSTSRRASDASVTGSGCSSPSSRRSSPTKADSKGRVSSSTSRDSTSRVASFASRESASRSSSGSVSSTSGAYSPSSRTRSEAILSPEKKSSITSLPSSSSPRDTVRSSSSRLSSSSASSPRSRPSSSGTQASTRASAARKDSGTALSKKDSGTALSKKDSSTSLSKKDSSTSVSRKSSQTSVTSASRKSSCASDTGSVASGASSAKSSPRPDSRTAKTCESPLSRRSSQRSERRRSSPSSGKRVSDKVEKGVSRSSSKSSTTSTSATGRSESPVENSRGTAGDDVFGDLAVNTQRMTSHMQQHRIKVAPGGRRKFTTNPIKALNDRADVASELAPSSPSATSMISKSAQLAGMNVSLAACAVAGLASKEDMSAVKLTSVSDVGSTAWPKTLLLRIKGRRNLQVRVVEPKASSVNSGDSFILVHSDKRAVYQFIGRTANVVERAKSADLLKDIVHGKDCGSRSASAIVVEEGKISSRSTESQFWSALSGKEGKPEGMLEEDGDDIATEKELISQIVVYEVSEQKLTVCKDMCAKTLKHAMFDSKKVFIFDFGNEVASWTGRRAPNAVRKKASQLVKEVFERGYIGKEGGRAKSKRAPWALLMNCKEGSESVLFRCKVHDWPDPGKVIQAKNVGYTNVVQTSKLVPCNAREMYQSSSSYPGLKVLQRNLGRGRGEAPRDDPCLPGVIVRTESVTKWLVKDNSCHELAEATYSEFYEGDAYIVRWTYSLHAERSNLKGEVQSKQVGSDQVVFFFWQGCKCRTSEKGTAALIVVELAGSEGDPQVRVVQGSEPPAFLQMFDGGMTVHCGSYKSPSDSDVCLYSVHGVLDHEAHLEELPSPVQYDSLRSRHSFLVVKKSSLQIYVWHGKSSPRKIQSLALKCAEKLAERQTDDNQASICSTVPTVVELTQGVDCSALKAVISGYQSSGLWDEGFNFGSGTAPRMFLFSVASGTFNFHHLERDWRHEDHHTAYPANQACLYEARQPALGLVQAGHELFVWCGWLPEQTEDDRSVGSLKSQFVETKKLAFETANSYLDEMKSKGLSKSSATVITAGYEPERFRSLFLHWTESAEAVTSVCKIKPCSQLEPIGLHQEMESMKGATYSLELLRSKPLPEDLEVDPKALEQYLSDSDFKIAFSRTREEFNALPSWKQLNLRKQAGLF